MTAPRLGPRERVAAEQFRHFYLDLLAIRDSIAPAAGGDDLPPADTAADAVPALRAPPGIVEVRTALTRGMAAAGYVAPDARLPRVVDVGYVMAAVADEVLLVQCPAWPARDAWIEQPLESVLYGSRLAGEWVFAAAAEIVEGRREDPATATAILLALLTGFRGRYHGGDDHGRIAGLRDRLYTLVCGVRYAADDRAVHAGPDLALTTLAGASMRRLPRLWPWIGAIAALLLLYLPVSHLYWRVSVADVAARAQAITDLAARPEQLQ